MDQVVKTIVPDDLEELSAAPGQHHRVPSLLPIPAPACLVSPSLTPSETLARTLGNPKVVATSCSSAPLQQESFPRQENPSHPPPGGPEPIPSGGNSANALVYMELEENSQNPDLARSYAVGGEIPRAILGRLDTNSPQDRSPGTQRSVALHTIAHGEQRSGATIEHGSRGGLQNHFHGLAEAGSSCLAAGTGFGIQSQNQNQIMVPESILGLY